MDGESYTERSGRQAVSQTSDSESPAVAALRRWQWAEAAAERCEALPMAAAFALHALAFHALRGFAWPSVATIAAHIHASPSTAKRALRALESRGVIKPAGKGPKGTTRWELAGLTPSKAKAPPKAPAKAPPKCVDCGETATLNMMRGWQCEPCWQAREDQEAKERWAELQADWAKMDAAKAAKAAAK